MKYYNTEKKYNRICFVTTQSGSIFYLKPLIEFLKKKKIPFSIFSNQKTKKTWKLNNIKSELISSLKIEKFKRFKLLIMSSVVKSDIEKKIILNNKKKNYIIQFVDHCVLLKDRFLYRGKIVLPDEIWALDNISGNELKILSKKKSKIYNMGHPGIEKIFKEKKAIKKNFFLRKKRVLVALQPLRNIKNFFKQDEFEMIKFCEDFKKKLNLNFIIKYALHPDHKKKDFKNFKNIILLQNQKNILKFDYLISFFSSLLHLGYFLNIPCASLILKNQKINLIFPGKSRIKVIKNEKNFVDFLKSSKPKFKINNNIKNSFLKITQRIEKLYHSKVTV